MASSAKRICFVHPDLGLGGAERLVVDAAVGLQNQGHTVTILTSHCDPTHCFDEARDGTLDVRVRGNSIFPPTLRGRLKILLSILRQVALVLSVAVFSSELKSLDPDVFVVDQLSACVPLFRLLHPRAKILFYGHFPDRLLAKEGTGMAKILKRLYRTPFDSIESWSTDCSDEIVVNSKFTRAVFRHTFARLRSRDLKVIYPCVDTEVDNTSTTQKPLWPSKAILLSINRFEGKKNLALAIKAFAGLSTDERSRARLVIAGGYDPREVENTTNHKDLQVLADSLNLQHTTLQGRDSSGIDNVADDVEVLFLLSIPEELKKRLLSSARILVYTPTNEHFGIVPLEAMVAGVPVLATNSGGPLETVYDGRTGWLRSPDKISQWTDVLRKPLIPSSADNLKAMGQRGHEHVVKEFSHVRMAKAFDQEIQKLCRSTATRSKVLPKWVEAMAFCILVAIVGGLIATGMTFYALKSIKIDN